MQQTLSQSLNEKDIIKNENECNCGDTKCVDGKLWKCLDIDGDGTCIWFITDDECKNDDKA
jgi:hypothetical protein